MTIGGCVRGGVLPRLLLMVVLATGVLVMHTVGHPDGDSGSGGGGSAHHVSVASHSTPDHSAHGGRVSALSVQDGHHQAESMAGDRDSAPMAEPREPMAAMDMASLCVAVLGVWVLTGLLCAAFTRRRGPPPGSSTPLSAAVRQRPPAPGPDLVALSVLRI